MKKYHNNADYSMRLSFDISEEARKDARRAWFFARRTGHPFNLMFTCQTPEEITGWREKVCFTWKIAHKFRTYCRSLGIPHYMIWVRESENDPPHQERTQYLVHVPDHLTEHFKTLVVGWAPGTIVEDVTYDEVVGDDGREHSVFNKMFKATSNESIRLRPNILHESSGPYAAPELSSLERSGRRLRQRSTRRQEKRETDNVQRRGDQTPLPFHSTIITSIAAF